MAENRRYDGPGSGILNERSLGGTDTSRSYPDSVDPYANAFLLTTEQCFRLIHAEDGMAHAQHCP